MARPERFELPTAWFVARYSIQLSYGRILKLDWRLYRNQVESHSDMAEREGLLGLRPRPSGRRHSRRSARLRRLSNQLNDYLGFESCKVINNNLAEREGFEPSMGF